MPYIFPTITRGGRTRGEGWHPEEDYGQLEKPLQLSAAWLELGAKEWGPYSQKGKRFLKKTKIEKNTLLFWQFPTNDTSLLQCYKVVQVFFGKNSCQCN